MRYDTIGTFLNVCVSNFGRLEKMLTWWYLISYASFSL